jgi:micrococcal nuclease
VWITGCLHATPRRSGCPPLYSRRASRVAPFGSPRDRIAYGVKIDGHEEKCRLVGIDAPELNDERQEYRDAAYAARNYARSRLGGEQVTLEDEPRQGDRDRYGRLLRYVILRDGTNFNEDMVRKGFAHVYDRFQFSLKPQFKAAETEAKHEKRGVWQLRPGPWRDVPDGH